MSDDSEIMTESEKLRVLEMERLMEDEPESVAYFAAQRSAAATVCVVPVSK